MNMKITDAARAQMKKFNERGHYLKISIERAGCCGYGYQFYESLGKKEDSLMEVDGEKVILAPRAKEMLEMQKTELDYIRKGLRKDFWIKQL
ncbi:Fe-S cluster assembly iron-binding protein IscA [Clostridiales Family XIII bacterium PM5-7]